MLKMTININNPKGYNQPPPLSSSPVVKLPVISEFPCTHGLSRVAFCVLRPTGARGTELPPPVFSNFLFTYLFSIKFLYFFIISSLFFLILTYSCQYSYNLMLTATHMFRSYIYTNYPTRQETPQV